MRGGGNPGFTRGEELFCEGQYNVYKTDGSPHPGNPFQWANGWWKNNPALPPNATFINYDSYSGNWETGTRQANLSVPIGGNEFGTTKLSTVSCNKPTEEQKRAIRLKAQRTGNTTVYDIARSSTSTSPTYSIAEPANNRPNNNSTPPSPNLNLTSSSVPLQPEPAYAVANE